MIKKIYSRTLKSFKTIQFNDGFNFLVSESINEKSNNGTGKTSLIQIINFCFGSSTEKISTYEDLNKESSIAKLLGFDVFDNYDEVGVYTRGYRILSKIPRMPTNIVENLVSSFKSFQHILAADIESLDEVDGIGEIRARTIKQSLKRMQEQFVFDNILD